MVSARTMLTFGIARGDDELESLAVTSRDMLQVERTVKGFATAEVLQRVTIEALYRIAYATLRRQGRVEADVKYEEFVNEWSVSLDDPAKSKRRQALANRLLAEGMSAADVMAQVALRDDEADEAVTTEDPTQPTA